MQRERQDPAMTPEEIRKMRARLWAAVRRAKATATTARDMLHVADLVGRASAFDAAHPAPRRGAR